MKLKRIIAIACTAAMTVSLISGCGGASDKGQKEAVKEAEGTAKEDLPLQNTRRRLRYIWAEK